MIRMFWACTHVTLRNVELPILIKAGFEVIPEEANPHVISRLEAASYDDSEHPSNQLWQKRTCLEKTIVTALRRARLSERKGLLDPDEQKLFNQHVDVIYIPTFLETAVNAKSWFKGTVIYRYFGPFSNMESLEEMAVGLDRQIMRDIYCLPIFATLADHDIGNYFDRWSVMHSLTDAQNTPPPWIGVQPNQSAVVVLSSAHMGEQLELARSLLPLARKIPITLMGKNTLELMPADILDSFEVSGLLERQEHFSRFSKARFVIYPNSSSHHMHYVPLEAIGAGIPLLCRDSIPLVKEYQTLSEQKVHQIGGIADSHSSLLAMATELYHRPAALPAIAEVQKCLPIAFSPENIEQEARRLLEAMGWRAGAKKSFQKIALAGWRAWPRNTTKFAKQSPLAALPTTRFLEVIERFALSEGIYPISDITPFSSNASMIKSGQKPPFDVALKLTNQKHCWRVMLGTSSSKFLPHITHRLTLRGTTELPAAVSVHAEIWIDDEIQKVWTAISVGQPDGSPFSASLSFSCAAPAQLLLVVELFGSVGALTLNTIEHAISSPETPHLGWSGDVIMSDENYPSELSKPEGIIALRAANFLGSSSIIHRELEAPVVGIKIDGKGMHALRLAETAEPMNGEAPTCLLDLYATEPSIIQAAVECWAGNKLVATCRHELHLVTGANPKTAIALPDCEGQAVVPIIFLELITGEAPLVTHLAMSSQ